MGQKSLLTAWLCALLVICGYCGYKVHTLSGEQEKVKEDFSIINNVSFGLLSVNNWRDQVDTILSRQIQQFSLTPEQRQELKEEIEQVLRTLVTTALKKINQPPKTLGGKLKKFAFKTMVDTADLYRQVPAFSDKIVQQINKPSNKEKIKDIAQSKLDQLSKQMYDSSLQAQTHVTDSVFRFYSVNEKKQFQQKTAALLSRLGGQTYYFTYGLFAVIAMMVGMWLWFGKRRPFTQTIFLFSLFCAFVMLLVGVTTTMIELDARLKALDFYILGSSISFDNEVLFFQSKSILSVVRILLSTGKIDMIVVACLIFCFSVLFPISKLIAEAIIIRGNRRLRENKIVRFFAFQSGKWSMSDVTVVAIMMAYIGMNGVLQSQLASMNVKSTAFTSITTNNTTLQPGYIVFVGFVVYSLFLSEALKKVEGQARSVKKPKPKPVAA